MSNTYKLTESFGAAKFMWKDPFFGGHDSWFSDDFPRVSDSGVKYQTHITCPMGPHKHLRGFVRELLNVTDMGDVELIKVLSESGKCFDLFQAEKICLEKEFFVGISGHILIQGAGGKVFVLSSSGDNTGGRAIYNGPWVTFSPIEEKMDHPMSLLVSRAP